MLVTCFATVRSNQGGPWVRLPHRSASARPRAKSDVVLGDLRIEELAAQRFEAFERALLVRPHQPRIRRHIGGEDRSETAGLAHSFPPIASRRPERYSSRCSGSRKGSG